MSQGQQEDERYRGRPGRAQRNPVLRRRGGGGGSRARCGSRNGRARRAGTEEVVTGSEEEGKSKSRGRRKALRPKERERPG